MVPPKYYLSEEQREREANRFKSPEDSTQLLIVVDMLLVGYDIPIVQVMYLDKGLREHTLLQAIARVNRPYDAGKQFGLIVDYSGITKELQKALAIFDEPDIKDVLTPFENEVNELKIRHAEAMSFFDKIDKNSNDQIIEKFEPISVRDNFEYAFKMFSKALDAVLPRKESNPFIDDFKYLSQKRQMIRNFYGGVAISLREDGKKVQQLIDDHIRSLKISKIMDVREITDQTFLSDVEKFKSEKAKTALIKNKARLIISEKAHLNPVYYERMKDRLEKMIEEENEGRKEDAYYFNHFKEILEELNEQENEWKKLGLTNSFEHSIFEGLLKITKNKDLTIEVTKKISKGIREETQLVGWKNKTSSEKQLGITIYDILTQTQNKKLEDNVDELTRNIIDQAKNHL